MKVKVVSIILAVALFGGSFSSISYAQDMQVETDIISEEKQNTWNYEGVNINRPSPQEINEEPIVISAKISGETKGLQYKFVWMRDDWKEWGIIRDFSDENNVEWNPNKIGKYVLYVDVKDTEGRMLTQKIPYEIIKQKWNYDSITTGPQEVQKKQEQVIIKANTSGNTDGLQYKFVWMRDNWKEWGVIQDFSKEREVVWKTPSKSGEYKIYVDIKDIYGETRTKKIDYSLVTQMWEPGEININDDIQEQVYTRIPITTMVTGETQNLQYKFVWKKGRASEGWDNGWGIIREFGISNQTNEWYPQEAGYYTIYVDIKDCDGRQKTVRKEYEVLAPSWKLEKLELDGSPDRFIGEKVKVTAVTSGDTEGLQYKFVCKRGDDWSDWEILKDFDSNASVEVPLSKAKDYNIYVDIKDKRGVIFEPEIVKIRSHRYDSVGISSKLVCEGQPVKIYPNVTGANGELQFKYVWMRDNWKEWGILKEFSNSASFSWTPPSKGEYSIYVDVKANGMISTKSIRIKVEDRYKAQLEEIKKYVYVPYVYGGTTTNGWDCSGFVQWSMKRMGVQLPRTSAEQSKVGTSVSLYNRAEWKPGDLLFYVNGGKVGHVALYLGDGMMMHALNPKRGTYITRVDEYSRIDKKNVLTYVKRVLKY